MGNQTSRQAGGGPRAVTTKGTKKREPDPKPTGNKDPGGLRKTFETETKYGGKVKGTPKTGGPPSVKSKEAARAKFMRDNPPSVKYATKKTKPKSPTKSSKKGGPGTRRRRSVGAAGGGRK